MATIDQLDMSIYNLYAIRTRMVEQINQEIRFDQAASIPPQTAVLDIYPKLHEIDILLGSAAVGNPWAYFFPPKKFRRLRRSPFSFSRIAPSLGDEEKQEAMLTAIRNVPCSTDEEEEERSTIERCIQQIDKVNEWLSFIIGRIGQFLQG